LSRAMLVAFAAVGVAALLSAATDKPQICRNEEFGITLSMPDGALLCPSEPSRIRSRSRSRSIAGRISVFTKSL
jgi:hypothetical protein